ncbi:AraC family transcriptional regulator [Rhizobium leucaenae]|uniref:AraC-like DNA-binding protein/quercetin dioxygenase-like cupin family protein n=1 Tax=Rhizobium leucaenae TaxID=29450 RepID=A0A7W6ZRQ2_9HYPH|nr:helix-turn-helix transcriptional regulator [Rhizobium leucaenae]MBB4567010.1 AraC-like DNA-binding protein/quercetin dioxygenase-like cupin family protein [Rhizobium leucaenae]MBB6300820.1 AraC-like DNA-binding protein/quercetin dioxygenase-like cupin family protein [Rhizobium leucaenae]
MEKLSQKLLATLERDHEQNMLWMEGSNAGVLVNSSEPPQGYTVPWHHHRRTQLLCVFSGVVLILTTRGRLMVPPGHALFIPVGLEHSVEMLSDVSIKSVYVMPSDPTPSAEAPRVVEVTDLARSLLLEAIRLREAPLGNRKAELVLSLLMEEISTLEERPLGLPFPSDRRLAALCRDYLANPTPNARLDNWAEKLAISRRTFTRQFRKETGISFTTWRQQASVFACLPQLAEGQPVTNVALEAGYESVAAFTTMFRRMLGTSPRTYMVNRWSFDRP